MYTKWLNETNINEISLVGGKNASLGEMISNLTNLGIDIPNGFIVTTIAYDKFIEDNRLEEKIQEILNNTNIDNNNEVKHASSLIKNLIYNGEFTDIISNEILCKYVELCKIYKDDNVDLAIRSSGSAEDLPDASFAGQQDTYLNVKGFNHVIDKIKSCFASLYNDRAICYRKTINYDSKKIKLAVCVQKMVRSDLASAGVAFSLDPDSGFKDIVVINGSYGLGELVVSGEVKPDEFIVFKPTLEKGFDAIIDKKLGDKQHKMVYSTNTEKRTQLVSVSDENKYKFCINDDKILLLSKWVTLIEKYYTELKGKWCPMDIEWAIDGNTNKLYIVQARPETIHSKKDSFELVEYKIKDGQNKKLLCEGTAVGDKISCGKAKIILNINDDIEFNDGDILVTENTSPDWEPIMRKASGIISTNGSRVSHCAIVSREMGLCCVVGCSDALKILKNDKDITIDCSTGEIGKIYDGFLDYEIIKTNIKDLPTIKTKLMLNVGQPEQAFHYSKIPNCGVGLAREEFIINNFIKVHPNAILNYNTIDNEIKLKIDELTVGFNDPIDYYIKKLSYGIARIGAAFYPKDVIVRFSDFKSNEYSNLLGGKYFEPVEENPMIGSRGCEKYWSDKFKKCFEMECQAIKYVREIIGLKNIIVMIPFCRTIDDCKNALSVMKQFGLERGVDGLQVYLMCEIPSNVILAEQFLQYVDGYSIGSNDLTQLTLGLDRDNSLISHLFDERNEAVKIMISMAIKTCKKNNKKIGICGNGPSSMPDFASFLVKEGIDSISLTPDAILKTVKQLYITEKEMNI